MQGKDIPGFFDSGEWFTYQPEAENSEGVLVASPGQSKLLPAVYIIDMEQKVLARSTAAYHMCLLIFLQQIFYI